MPVGVKLTPQSGGEIEFSVDRVQFDVRRQTGENGRLSAAYPDFRKITLDRSLQNSVAKDDGTDRLLENVAAIGEEAVFSGSVTAYQANQPQTPYMQIRFDEAHIETIDVNLKDGGGQGAVDIVQRIVLAVSKFSANNANFTRAGQTAA